MPVIVVGADTESGREIADGLWSPDREVRVFVSDPDTGADFKERGFKVAVGDLSDDSHVEAAATDCFTMVLVAEAARDGRDLAFAESESEVLSGWASAVKAAKPTRVIWVTDQAPPVTEAAEVVTVDPSDHRLVETVAALDDARLLP